MRPELKYLNGKPIIPEGYMFLPERKRIRNGIQEIVPAHLRKLPGPKKGILEGENGEQAPESKILAARIIRAVRSEILLILDKMEKSL